MCLYVTYSVSPQICKIFSYCGVTITYQGSCTQLPVAYTVFY